MKYISITILILLFVFVYSNAQVRKEMKWSCSFAVNSVQAQIGIPLFTGPGVILIDADGNLQAGGKRTNNSYSISIIPKYNIGNDILMRFEFGSTDVNLESNSDNNDGFLIHSTNIIKVSTKIYKYSAGLQWLFIKTKMIESYCGLTATFINYKPLNYSYYSLQRNFSNDTLISWQNGKEITPGGFAIGLGALAGFGIQLNKWAFIGAELSSSLLYYSLGGVTEGKETQQYIPNPSFSLNSRWSNSFSGFNISKIITSFNITIKF